MDQSKKESKSQKGAPPLKGKDHRQKERERERERKREKKKKKKSRSVYFLSS